MQKPLDSGSQSWCLWRGWWPSLQHLHSSVLSSHPHWARRAREDVHTVDVDGSACQGCKAYCAMPCRGTSCVHGCCGGGSVDMPDTANARAALTCHGGSWLSAPPQPSALCQDEHKFLVKPAQAPLTTHWHTDMVAMCVCRVSHCRNF